MPVAKNAIRRLCATYSIIRHSHYISKENLIERLSEKMDETFSKSSMEKTMFTLRMDFDINLKYSRRNKGYFIENADDDRFIVNMFHYLKLTDLEVISDWIHGKELLY